MFSQGDQAKTVNRPSCEATSAMRVALVVDELRGRQVARAAELRGIAGHRLPALDRFGDHHLRRPAAPLAPGDLGAEREQLVVGAS